VEQIYKKCSNKKATVSYCYERTKLAEGEANDVEMKRAFEKKDRCLCGKAERVDRLLLILSVSFVCHI